MNNVFKARTKSSRCKCVCVCAPVCVLSDDSSSASFYPTSCGAVKVRGILSLSGQVRLTTDFFAVQTEFETELAGVGGLGRTAV